MPETSTALIAPRTVTIPPEVAGLASQSLWCGTTEFAALAGINRQNAHAALTRCLNGMAWRGEELKVRVAESGRGLQVFAPSLPRQLLDIWKAQNPSILESTQVPVTTVPAPAVFDSGIGARVAEMNWKISIIAPALAFPKGSHARADTLRDLAASKHPDINGNLVSFSIDTLRDWCALVADGNPHDLARPRRADSGKRRQFVCRAWDKACPLPDAEKTTIADAIDQHLRSLWRPGTSERKIQSLATTKLRTLSIDAGWRDAPLIDIGLHAVRRFSAWRKLAINETDAKRFHDLYTPRIHRSRDDLKPMEIVLGDVHPLDVLITRDDRSTATPRLISWLDLATGRLFCAVVLYPKGKSVTQADVTASFVEMVLAWGLPRTLYLDNGSEYKWEKMKSGFEALQGLVSDYLDLMFEIMSAEEIDAATGMGEDILKPADSPPAIVRAKPYNAQAKAIEGAFAALEKFMKLIDGYIGGNRMKKKTHNVGKAPKPYPGTFEQFRDSAFKEALAFYHNEPQGGTMGDKSPNQRTHEANTAGFQPFTARREVFLYAFAEVRRCKVHNKGIEIDGEWFQCADIVPKVCEYIEVRYAKWDGTHALWINDEGQPVLIPLATKFHPLDRAGAKYQGQLSGCLNRHIANLAKDAPRIDTVAEMARHNAALPPAPETPAGIPIILDGEAQRIVDAIGTAQAAQPSVTPLPDVAAFDLYALPPPQKVKPGASADASGFDIYELFNPAPKPSRKETESK